MPDFSCSDYFYFYLSIQFLQLDRRHLGLFIIYGFVIILRKIYIPLTSYTYSLFIYIYGNIDYLLAFILKIISPATAQLPTTIQMKCFQPQI